ncbi:MAG: cell division protein SepF [Nitriliruptoraceae bacterium]
MSPGVWNRTMVYLGLRDDVDPGHDDHPDPYDPADDAPSQWSTMSEEPRLPARHEPDMEVVANVRPLHTGEAQAVRRGGSPTAPLRTPVIEILVFDDVEQVGARYRTGQPVLFDVTRADRETGRRVVDFVAGLTYISRGHLSKVGDPAFLLIPEGMQLPEAERRRLGELGYRIPVGGDA